MVFELQLDLSRHCIETEIKRQHNSAVSQYFRADGKAREDLEKIVDVTRQALETFDFRHLRSAYLPLAGKSDARVVLREADGRIGIRLDGVDISSEN